MTSITIEVTPADAGWVVKRYGPKSHHDRFLAMYRWKFQAVLVAKFFARHISEMLPKDEAVELVIKNRKGQIRERNTYGYDPEASKG